MLVKEIKNELRTNNKSVVGIKNVLWNRLIDMRCDNAKILNDEKPFGGPALEMLLDRVYENRWSVMNFKKKGLVRKEIAGHITNYPELPTYFGKKMYCYANTECILCKEVCVCNELSPPRISLNGNWSLQTSGHNYQELKNLWAEARKEWEIIQEPTRMKEAKILVESAPLITAILPCEICDLIAEKVALLYYEEPYEKLENKKLTAHILNQSQNRCNKSKMQMTKSLNRLNRCGNSTRPKRINTGTDVILSPLIQSRRLILENDYHKKLNELSILEKEHQSLTKKDVGFSVRIYQWVPI